MLAWLVLLSGLQYAWAVSDIPIDTRYVTRQDARCPSPDVFFLRESSPKSLAPLCYFCFCRSNTTAVCWERQTRGCDAEHYQNFGQSNSRSRRSSLSLGDLPVRDAARHFFSEHTSEQCQPFESSFSNGCPPVDWCNGCTVCDCDAKGRWDCHVLSFCPDKNSKTQMKKKRGNPNRRTTKRRPTNWSTSATTKNKSRPLKKPSVKSAGIRDIHNNEVKRTAISQYKTNPGKSSKINKFASIKKPLPKVQAKKGHQSRNKVTRKPLYIKKNALKNKTLTLKSSSDKSNKNNTLEMAQKVVKQFMSTMQKMLKQFDAKTSKTHQVNKVLKKRSMSKQDFKATKKDKQKLFLSKSISNANKKGLAKKNIKTSNNTSTKKYGRVKRQVTVVKNVNNNGHSNYSHMRNATTEINDYRITDKQNLFVNNNTSSVFNVPYNSSNKILNVTELKNSMDREVYITDKHIDIGNTNNILNNTKLYNDINNTRATTLWTIDDYNNIQKNNSNKSSGVVISTTNHSYLSLNETDYNYNISDLKANLREYNNDDKNLTHRKEIMFSNASTQTGIHKNEQMCPFKTLLQKLISTNLDNNTISNYKNAKTPKRYTILTKIKRLFKKVFNKRNKLHHKGDFYYREHDLRQYAYKISEHCKLDLKEKDTLRQRLIELKSESEEILRTIGIVKSLLHIFQIDNNKTLISSELYRPIENFRKLNIILRNPVYKGKNGDNLKGDQRTQINRIKDNVRVFIKSIGNFARILYDIIQLAMCNIKKESVSGKAKVNGDHNTINKIVKYNGNITQYKLEKLKKLIIKYNILQNKFINNIYLILSNLEPNLSDKNKLKSTAQNGQYVKASNTDEIETNASNIIKNIKKLKMLIMEKNSAQNRQKRSVVDDDNALEYLLFLMEFLLKKHSPVYHSTDDGLDLLIEAIKSAPDIKLSRKKILDIKTKKPYINIPTTPGNTIKKHYNNSTSNIVRAQKYSSDEISNISNNKIKTSDQSLDEASDDEYKIEDLYRSFKDNKQSSSEQENDMSGRSNHSITSESYYNVFDTTTRMIQNRYNVVLKVKADDSLEEVTILPSTLIAIELDKTSESPATETLIINDNKNEINFSSKSDNFVVDSKANIDWIEENFKDIKQSREVEGTSFTPTSLNTARTRKHSKHIIIGGTATKNQQHAENKSDFTKNNKSYNKKTTEKSSAEDNIMSKKQTNLLNSLDYVEDETDSKDDTFLGDTYFRE